MLLASLRDRLITFFQIGIFQFLAEYTLLLREHFDWIYLRNFHLSVCCFLDLFDRSYGSRDKFCSSVTVTRIKKLNKTKVVRNPILTTFRFLHLFDRSQANRAVRFVPRQPRVYTIYPGLTGHKPQKVGNKPPHSKVEETEVASNAILRTFCFLDLFVRSDGSRDKFCSSVTVTRIKKLNKTKVVRKN